MRYSIFGESHGSAIGVVLEQVPPGLVLDREAISKEMARRAPGKSPLSTARKEADILHRMWCKFMLNVGVNQVCMAYACGYGGVQAPGPARDTMIAAMNEARKVGACQGVLVTQKDLREYVAVLDSLNPEAMPSMRQDALAHRPSEVELFAGTVIQLAEFYGMQVPVNRALYQTIQEMETNW